MPRKSIRGHERLQKKTKEEKDRPIDSKSIEGFAEKYYSYLALQNYAKATIISRRKYLGFFISWCKEKNIGRPADVTRFTLEKYKWYLYHYRKSNDMPLTFGSQAVRLDVVRSFFKFLAKKYHIIYNPASELELPMVEERLPRNILSHTEVEKIMAQPDLQIDRGLRDRAIMEVLYSTGMRRLELVHLKLHDISFERGTIMIRQGKGRKDRVVPIGDRALFWLEKYLAEARPNLIWQPDNGLVFVTNAGEILRANYLSEVVRIYFKKAGIKKDGACHVFRHTVATLMHENGADIRYVQQLLGHTDLRSTQVYTKVSIRKLKEIHDSTHPASGLPAQPGKNNRLTKSKRSAIIKYEGNRGNTG